MQFQFSFKHMDSSDALRTYAQQKIEERVLKFTTKPMTVHVTFAVDRHNHTAHCSVSGGDGFNVEVEHVTDDMYASVDKLVDKLATQLKRVKDKMKDHKGKPSRGKLAGKTQKEIDIEQAEIDAADILKFEAKRRAGNS